MTSYLHGIQFFMNYKATLIKWLIFLLYIFFSFFFYFFSIRFMLFRIKIKVYEIYIEKLDLEHKEGGVDEGIIVRVT